MTGKFLMQLPDSAIEVPWGRLRFLCNPAISGSDRLAVVHGLVNDGTGHDFHVHPQQDEVIYVVSGTVEQWLGEESRLLGAGDGVFIPAGTVHASFAAKGQASLIAIFGPAIGDGLEMIDVSAERPWNALRSEPRRQRQA